MLAEITIDGMVDEEFRHAIEVLLREGQAEQAETWLRSRIALVSGPGLPLPERFPQITSADLLITGWEDIAGRLAHLDALGAPITAIGIDLSDPGHIGLSPDPSGLMPPHVETHYYSDDAWPFSRSDRASLLGGYVGAASRWADRFVEVDDTIGIAGIDDLYGAVFALEQRCRPGGDASEEERRAYMLGASFIAVLAHIAVRDTAMREGLPRPMAVLVGSNESYPFVAAPAVAAPDAFVCEPALQPAPIAGPVADTTGPGHGSFAPATYQPATGPAEPFEDHRPLEETAALLELRELADPGADPGLEPEGWEPPEVPAHTTGTQLRRRIVTPESIAELEALEKPSLFQRLFRRK